MRKFLFPFTLLIALVLLSLQTSTQPGTLQAQNTRQQKPPFLVCIDPGHPSETSAGANAHGLSENRLNWQVAVRLAQRLHAMKIPYVLTKTSEKQYVTNRRRAEIANGANAYRQPTAIFIRLHCDVGSGRGFTWYYPDRTGRKGNVVGPPLSVQVASRNAAYTMNSAMIPVLRGYLRTNPIKTDASTYVGGKQGGVLTGSIYSKVPTALIEMCYINQKADAQFIASEKGRDKMAEAMAAGIVRWKQIYER
jgi:N-acetylmuramoyl-L-alanine amidase